MPNYFSVLDNVTIDSESSIMNFIPVICNDFNKYFFNIYKNHQGHAPSSSFFK
jgi:hypothetical protein